MPATVIGVLAIELALVAFTSLLLTQPRKIFGHHPRSGAVLRLGGIFLLCITFCWSVVVGAVLVFNGILI